MIYAVLSDIHSNLEALQAVLKDLASEKVHSFLILGDIIGYGPNPNECIEIVKKLQGTVIAGNHEGLLRKDFAVEQYNSLARESIRWTRKNILHENVKFIENLSYLKEMPNFLIVHGSPRYPEEYLFNIQEVNEAFSYFQKRYPQFYLCFFGHTHKQAIWCKQEDKVYLCQGEDTFHLSTQSYYLINPGSVGQPRDGSPEANYAIYDTSTQKLLLRKVPYNYQLTLKKILKVGLPPALGYRLGEGK